MIIWTRWNDFCLMLRILQRVKFSPREIIIWTNDIIIIFKKIKTISHLDTSRQQALLFFLWKKKKKLREYSNAF